MLKKIKKVIAFALALTMLMGMGTMVSAAEKESSIPEYSETNDGGMTVNIAGDQEGTIVEGSGNEEGINPLWWPGDGPAPQVTSISLYKYGWLTNGNFGVTIKVYGYGSDTTTFDGRSISWIHQEPFIISGTGAYGQQQATFSALLAVAGYCFRQMYHRSGFDVMLDYNTYVWIAQLLILGLAVGYLRDQLRAMREEQRHEVSYLTKQLDDISDINVSNVRVKEILANQIVNQNDSFGKLYEITSSLEQYEPCEVLFYAAEVLAKLMGSKDVAIYTVANRSYARLFSATSEKARSLGNSINYSEMDAMYTVLAGKKVYINKNMDERYPLMANAIYSEDEMQLILMIWGIPWERMTLGQANMLTVIGYLIQNAVVRANRYISALEQQRYIKGTNILEPEAFLALVKAYLNARDKGLTQCALLSVDTKENDRDEVGKRLIKLLRQSDYVGELEGGKMYALLANTSAKDATMVKERFEKEGVSCQIQEDVFV